MWNADSTTLFGLRNSHVILHSNYYLKITRQQKLPFSDFENYSVTVVTALYFANPCRQLVFVL